MRNQKQFKFRRTVSSQAGISLIEMMIALVLGLIVVSAVFNVFIGSSRSASFSDGLRTMQENGRHGIQVLQKGMRRAGYHPSGGVEPFDIAASSGTSISVRMAALTDCNGQSTAAEAGIATNTYVFDATNKQVTCEGGTAAATVMPLIDYVDAMQILYGEDTSKDGVADQYVAYRSTLNPYDIKAIRFALLVNSVEPIRTRAISQTHVVLNEEFSSNDRIARNVFTTTVLLRNSR